METQRLDRLSRRRLVLGLGAGLLAATAALAEEAEVVAATPRRRRRVAAPKAAPAAAAVVQPPAAPPPGVTPEAAMERLMAGNLRYASGGSVHPNVDMNRRAAAAAAQTPFACILACADSRVPPEILFDQGLGDLFVNRVAGNVVDDAVLASIEYSVIHLGCTLVMVLGHERCGTVKATIEALDGRGSEDDRDTKIGALAALITPAVRAVPAWATDRVDAAVSLNATHVAAEIFANSRPLRARVLAGRLKIVAARYDLDDGIVTPAKA